MEPLVSIVVPTFNRRSSLKRLLEALAEQTYPHASFEVVVVDDGSTDGSVELGRSLALPYALRVVEQPHDGPAAARNLGVEQARGALILFLDDDVVPLPDLITTHVATHQGNPNSVVVGPMSPPSNWPRPAWIRWEEDKLEVQYRALLAGEYPCTPRQFYTANASLSRGQFLDVGGFDPRFQRAEDVELAFRLATGVSGSSSTRRRSCGIMLRAASRPGVAPPTYMVDTTSSCIARRATRRCPAPPSSSAAATR